VFGYGYTVEGGKIGEKEAEKGCWNGKKVPAETDQSSDNGRSSSRRASKGRISGDEPALRPHAVERGGKMHQI